MPSPLIDNTEIFGTSTARFILIFEVVVFAVVLFYILPTALSITLTYITPGLYFMPCLASALVYWLSTVLSADVAEFLEKAWSETGHDIPGTESRET